MSQVIPHAQEAERDLIGLQAAQWFCALAEGGPEQRAAFVEWLKKSPWHVEEFLLVSTVWKGLDRAGPHDSAGMEQLLALARSQPAMENVVALQGHGDVLPHANKSAAASNKRIASFAALAAGFALVALCLFQVVPVIPDYWHTYSTSTGEQRSVRLADGSVVHLNAQSRLRVEYSGSAREIVLIRGEAIFKVEQDAARPFRVHAGDAVIQALGTQFNVYRREKHTTVSVLEGVVRVEAPLAPSPGMTEGTDAPETVTAPILTAGEGARIETGGKIIRQTGVDIARATAWRERRLVFRADRLEDIAAEFSRYSPRRIVLTHPSARDKRITGTFDADDPASLVLFLRKLDEFSVEETPEQFIIRPRPES